MGGQRDFIKAASVCKKPADQAAMMPLLKDIMGAMKDADATVDPRSDWCNHQKCVKEGLAIMNWLMHSPKPIEFIKEQITAQANVYGRSQIQSSLVSS